MVAERLVAERLVDVRLVAERPGIHIWRYIISIFSSSAKKLTTD